MDWHERYVVTVHGEKPPYYGNEEYYHAISDVATQLSQERGVPMVFYPRMKEEGTAIIDIVSPTEKFANELGDIIRNLGKFEHVEVRNGTVDLKNPHGNN